MAKVQSHSEMSLAAPMPVAQDEDIDLVALTMAALRFVNPWSVEAEPRWSDRIVPGTPEAKDRTITLAEVACHDTPNDCWVVIYDRVYDISTFLDEVSMTTYRLFNDLRIYLTFLIGKIVKYFHIKIVRLNCFSFFAASWWSRHNAGIRRPGCEYRLQRLGSFPYGLQSPGAVPGGRTTDAGAHVPPTGRYSTQRYTRIIQNY